MRSGAQLKRDLDGTISGRLIESIQGQSRSYYKRSPKQVWHALGVQSETVHGSRCPELLSGIDWSLVFDVTLLGDGPLRRWLGSSNRAAE
jgi:hypothetical protein